MQSIGAGSFSIREHPYEQAETEGNAHGFVRVMAHVIIGRTKAGSRLLFETAAACLDSFERFHDLAFGFFGEVTAGGLDEVLGVMDERDQVLHESLLGSFFGSHVLEKRFHIEIPVSHASDRKGIY
jgi:hypothetical protein